MRGDSTHGWDTLSLGIASLQIRSEGEREIQRTASGRCLCRRWWLKWRRHILRRRHFVGRLEKWLGGRFVSVVLQRSRLADWSRAGGAKLKDNVPCLRLPGLDSTTLAFSSPIPNSHPSRTCTPRKFTSSTDRQFFHQLAWLDDGARSPNVPR